MLVVMDSTPVLGFAIRNKSFARLYFFPAITGSLTEMLFGCFALECKYISLWLTWDVRKRLNCSAPPGHLVRIWHVISALAMHTCQHNDNTFINTHESCSFWSKTKLAFNYGIYRVGSVLWVPHERHLGNSAKPIVCNALHKQFIHLQPENYINLTKWSL